LGRGFSKLGREKEAYKSQKQEAWSTKQVVKTAFLLLASCSL
jgi:hypothetical protein